MGRKSRKSRKPTPESILEANMKGFLDSFQKYKNAHMKVQVEKCIDIQSSREASFEQIQNSSVVTSADVKKILDFFTNNPEFDNQIDTFLNPCLELLHKCMHTGESSIKSDITEIKNTSVAHTLADYWPKDK